MDRVLKPKFCSGKKCLWCLCIWKTNKTWVSERLVCISQKDGASNALLLLSVWNWELGCKLLPQLALQLPFWPWTNHPFQTSVWVHKSHRHLSESGFWMRDALKGQKFLPWKLPGSTEMPFLLFPCVSLVPAGWSIIFWMRRKLQLNLQFKVLLSYLSGGCRGGSDGCSNVLSRRLCCSHFH